MGDLFGLVVLVIVLVVLVGGFVGFQARRRRRGRGGPPVDTIGDSTPRITGDGAGPDDGRGAR
jgi:hypothetical protein